MTITETCRHGTPEAIVCAACVDLRPRRYAELGRAIGELVEKKQAAYGDSFGKSGQVLRLLYPDGIPLEKLDDALVVVRILDKLFRIATDRDALGESPFRDIAGYALLAVARAERVGDIIRPSQVAPGSPWDPSPRAL